ncbi:MAG: TrkH family potassium uptake protein [Oscillospiraceae bacterium]|nr:TrkH family potassium uptake protein [Oscillospiraceae bacterium]
MNYKMVLYIIGQILKVEAAVLLLPLSVALIYGEYDILPAFFITIGAVAVAGLLFSFRRPEKRAIFAKEGFVVVSCSWILLSLFGCLPFFLSGYIPSFVDSFFETVSGFSTTGASILRDVEALPQSLLFWRSFTHWIGGMGVLVFVLAVIPRSDTDSMHLMRAEMPGPTVGKLVSRIRHTARILYVIYFILTVVMMVFLLCGGMPLFDSIVTAFGTAGTGGFGVKNASIAYYNSVYIDVVVTVFMILFGINFNLFFLIITGNVAAALKSEELRWYLGIIAGAILLIALNILGMQEGDFLEALRYAGFQVAAVISTTGYTTADFNLWPTFSKIILVLLMFFGGCAGSTAGGIKISRVILLVKMGIREMRQMLRPREIVTVRLEKKPVEEKVLRGCAAFFILLFAMIALSCLVISFDGYDVTTTITAVLTCINNVGPGLEAVGPSGNFAGFSDLSKLVLCVDMLIGRLELFPILMLFSPAVWKKR